MGAGTCALRNQSGQRIAARRLRWRAKRCYDLACGVSVFLQPLDYPRLPYDKICTAAMRTQREPCVNS